MATSHTRTPELETDAIIDALLDISAHTKPSQEGTLLQRKLQRSLYKQVPAPTRETFPDECKTARVDHWHVMPGCTTGIATYSRRTWSWHAGTTWHIARPSATKLAIVDRYARDGWGVVVSAYNVMCEKVVKHSTIPHLGVRFISTRDRADYEFVLLPDGEV